MTYFLLLSHITNNRFHFPDELNSLKFQQLLIFLSIDLMFCFHKEIYLSSQIITRSTFKSPFTVQHYLLLIGCRCSCVQQTAFERSSEELLTGIAFNRFSLFFFIAANFRFSFIYEFYSPLRCVWAIWIDELRRDTRSCSFFNLRHKFIMIFLYSARYWFGISRRVQVELELSLYDKCKVQCPDSRLRKGLKSLSYFHLRSLRTAIERTNKRKGNCDGTDRDSKLKISSPHYDWRERRRESFNSQASVGNERDRFPLLSSKP